MATSLIANFTTSAIQVFPTSISNGTYGGGNSTLPTPSVPIDGDISEGSYVLNTLIGLLIVIIASCLNAFGLNLTKLDHTRQQAIPRRERRKEYLRPLWLAGMGMYIISQIFGSTLALRWLRPDWVAPLGSSSLIFNFLFASWLVGTPVTPTDIRGTAVIVLGVILILVFSSINHGLQQSLSIDRLSGLWIRGSWIAYFTFLLAFTTSTYIASHLLAQLLASRASFSPLPSPTIELRPTLPKKSNAFIGFFKKLWSSWKSFESLAIKRLERLFQRSDDARITWLEGIGWAVAGGSLAGMCLVFTKAVVKLLGTPGHPMVHPSAILTLLLVIGTAVLQIICLNKALRCADTVVVVPLFYAGYTVFGFINSLIFYDEAGQYARWVLVAVFLSIAVLISGVVLLSLKSSAKTAPDPYNATVTTEADRSVRMRPRPPNHSGSVGAEAGTGTRDDASAAEEGEAGLPGNRKGGEDVLWEVGSISDSEGEDENDKSKEGGPGEDGEDNRKGIGGGNVRGERRGLLVDENENENEEEYEYDDSAQMITDERVNGLKISMNQNQHHRSPLPEEAEHNPFADPGDESFGEFNGNSSSSNKQSG